MVSINQEAGIAIIITNYKGRLSRGSWDLHQQHSRYSQGGLCDDYCGMGSAGESVRYFQFQSGRSTWDWSTENYV